MHRRPSASNNLQSRRVIPGRSTRRRQPNTRSAQHVSRAERPRSAHNSGDNRGLWPEAVSRTPRSLPSRESKSRTSPDWDAVRKKRESRENAIFAVLSLVRSAIRDPVAAFHRAAPFWPPVPTRLLSGEYARARLYDVSPCRAFRIAISASDGRRHSRASSEPVTMESPDGENTICSEPENWYSGKMAVICL